MLICCFHTAYSWVGVYGFCEGICILFAGKFVSKFLTEAKFYILMYLYKQHNTVLDKGVGFISVDQYR